MNKKLFLITIFSSMASMTIIFASCDLFNSSKKIGGDSNAVSTNGTICHADSDCQTGQVCNTANGYCGPRNTTPAGAVIFVGDNTDTCPDGYTDNGIIGLLSNNGRVLLDYTLGGALGTSSTWTWAHPKMCISTGSATSYSTNSVALVTSTTNCPARSTEVGQTGVIWNSSSSYFYGQGDQLENEGGDLNTAWWWTNPLICTNDTAASPTVKGSIVFANATGTCPSGYTEKGKIGIIEPSSGNCGAFDIGGTYGTPWHWCHPYLCVKD